MNRFSEEDIRRYSRQILLTEVGGRGQERLLEATATLVGAGSIGETTAQYLGRAGVKRLRLFATDIVATHRLRSLIESEGANLGRRMVLLPLLEAPGTLRNSLETAQPVRFTVGHWDNGGPEEFYWAVADEAGVTVGRGAEQMNAERQARSGSSQPASGSDAESAIALLAGSALALFMMQSLLGIEPPSPVRLAPAAA